MKLTIFLFFFVSWGQWGSSRKLSSWQGKWNSEGKFWEGIYTEDNSKRVNLAAFVRVRPEFDKNYLKRQVCTKYYEKN